MKKIKICETIRELRKSRDITQEVLGEALGVSVQAVSKWETSSSLPDTCMLPDIAAFFCISLDDLFFGLQDMNSMPDLPFPDDQKLRIVQYYGNKLLSSNEYDRDIKIPIKIPDSLNELKITAEIWGSAYVKGNIGGDLTVSNGANCGNVGGKVEAGNGVNCGDINGGVHSGGGVNCGNINGGVHSGGGINCGGISGGIRSCSGDIHCHKIEGDVNCSGNIIYK